MARVLLTEIDPREQKQIAAAENAIKSGSAGVAMETCLAVIGRHPECTQVRRLLHQAQKLASGKRPSTLSGFSKAIAAMGVVSVKAALKDPRKAMMDAEKKLCKDPYDYAANMSLANAGEAAGLWDVVGVAYENIVAVDPKMENFSKLVSALLKDKDPDRALTVVDAALKKFPNNGDLQELARQVSVAQTMNNGAWDESKDYRSKLANSDKAIELEKKSRVVSDEETAKEAIVDLQAQIEKNPADLQLYRELARNYKVLGDLDAAVEAIQRARETENGKVDATLEKQEHALMLENYEKRIKEAEDYLKENPDDAEYKEYLASLKASLDDYSLQSIKALVEKYPNDYNYRYDYGLRLLAADDVNGAIRELQLAQRAPKNRHAAMLNLGRAFVKSGKFDLAADQLRAAKDELKQMSDIKKDIVYELATALEKSGDSAAALAEYKAIYMADASYKDVADKINRSYS
ncbi:MAG: hypothetical protein K6B46_06120 [Opitutales bacterium]|nr:hypothetical protein [Opitutales bacterium]